MKDTPRQLLLDEPLSQHAVAMTSAECTASSMTISSPLSASLSGGRGGARGTPPRMHEAALAMHASQLEADFRAVSNRALRNVADGVSDETPVRPSGRPPIYLLPTDIWNEGQKKTPLESLSHSNVNTPPSVHARPRPSSVVSSNVIALPTPGEGAMQTQVKELAEQVARLAEKLHAAHGDLAQANARSEELRSANDDLRKQIQHCHRVNEELQKARQEESEAMRAALEEQAEKARHSNRANLEMTHTIAQLQGEVCYKEMQRTKDLVDLSGRHVLQAWKVLILQSSRSYRLTRSIVVRKLMHRIFSWWRLAVSPHLSYLREYARSNAVHIEKLEPLQAAMVLAECGEIILIHQAGWKPRMCRSVLRCWGALLQSKRIKCRQLDFMRRRFTFKFSVSRRTCFREWSHIPKKRRTAIVRSTKLYLRVACRNTRVCFSAWRDQHTAILRKGTACSKFCHVIVRKLLSTCLHCWRYEFVSLGKSIRRFQKRRIHFHARRTFDQLVWWYAVSTDSMVVKLLQSALCPLAGRLSLAKSSSIAWRRLGRRTNAKTRFQIGCKFRRSVGVALWSLRFMRILIAWRSITRLRCKAKISVYRQAFRALALWRGLSRHLEHIKRTGSTLAKRTSLLLMYDVMAEWYALLHSRFHQVLRVARSYFLAWGSVTRSQVSRRESKAQVRCCALLSILPVLFLC